MTKPLKHPRQKPKFCRVCAKLNERPRVQTCSPECAAKLPSAIDLGYAPKKPKRVPMTEEERRAKNVAYVTEYYKRNPDKARKKYLQRLESGNHAASLRRARIKKRVAKAILLVNSGLEKIQPVPYVRGKCDTPEHWRARKAAWRAKNRERSRETDKLYKRRARALARERAA